MRTLFVTGTDTGVGKTRFCSLLVKALRSRGVNAVGMKPFCCGEREDAELLHAACAQTVDIALINPVWLRVPAAPYAACLVENRLLDLDAARAAFAALSSAHDLVVVEGVGGWRVPLRADFCTSDFAAELGAPVLVVSANKLGTLNHTQLTVDAIRNRSLPCLGVVLNQLHAVEGCPAAVTNAAVLEHILDVPLLGELPLNASELPPPLTDRMHALLGSAPPAVPC
jgi:dethiobiotin synthetase